MYAVSFGIISLDVPWIHCLLNGEEMGDGSTSSSHLTISLILNIYIHSFDFLHFLNVPLFGGSFIVCVIDSPSSKLFFTCKLSEKVRVQTIPEGSSSDAVLTVITLPLLNPFTSYLSGHRELWVHYNLGCKAHFQMCFKAITIRNYFHSLLLPSCYYDSQCVQSSPFLATLLTL